MENSAKAEQATQIRDKVLELGFLETVEILPRRRPSRTRSRVSSIRVIHALGHDDEQPNRFLEAQGTTREEMDAGGPRIGREVCAHSVAAGRHR